MNTVNTGEPEIIFVSDFYSDKINGGAELTTDALLSYSNLKFLKLESKNITIETLQRFSDKYWIFCNFAMINFQLIPVIANNLRYSVIEYDYKLCKYRLFELHANQEGFCNCENDQHGKLIEFFYLSSQSIFWMSEEQKNTCIKKFPSLKDKENIILSSVFSKNQVDTLKSLAAVKKQKNSYAYLESNSWVKGSNLARDFFNKKSITNAQKIENLSYEQTLDLLSKTENLVYLPNGSDTCPRLVIEAKLLDCNLILNNYVQHAKESWFNRSKEQIFDYLENNHKMFWENINKQISGKKTISGYLTTKDCLEMEYPFEDCIKSLLGFCDQVVVVDGGSKDGTWEKLELLATENKNLLIKKIPRDWSDTRHAIFDGAQKAEARNLCTSDFCWQADADEIVRESDYEKIKLLINNFPGSVNLMCLPVIEYWGSKEKVRIDVNPWKWRVSRNLPWITHGVPKHLRKYDEQGKLYTLPGSDGCDYISKETGEYVPYLNFYDENADNLRKAALITKSDSAISEYQKWFQMVVDNIPTVVHLSWLNMERKIKAYPKFWQKFWESMYNIKQEDTAENNMFFNKPWSQVSDQEMKQLAKDLSEKTGGHIFHTKLNLDKPTPWIKINV